MKALYKRSADVSSGLNKSSLQDMKNLFPYSHIVKLSRRFTALGNLNCFRRFVIASFSLFVSLDHLHESTNDCLQSILHI